MKRIQKNSLLFLLGILLSIQACGPTYTQKPLVQIELGRENGAVSALWKEVLRTRQSAHYIDSLGQVVRPLSVEEQAWVKHIEERVKHWEMMIDSIKQPFPATAISDTITVLIGFGGYDDGFTYGFQTVCLDVSALAREYGAAEK